MRMSQAGRQSRTDMTASEIILPGDESISVVAQRAPFSSDLIYRNYPAGITLAEILDDVQPNPVMQSCAHVMISGEIMDRAQLHRIRPKAGRVVNISIVPQMGGGQKNPLRFILMLAVTAASLYVGGLPALAGPLIGGVSVGSIAGAATAGCGPLALQAFAHVRRDR